MGCSNARLLVQTPMSDGNTIANSNVNNPLTTSANETAPTIVVSPDTNNSSTRMHLTGVDLVVERNGSYTLLLTPKTHKQLMPYVLRKKRFRILVDKPRTEGTSTVNQRLTSYDLTTTERTMESGKELKLSEKKNKKQNKQKMESTIEAVQQAASDELDKAKARFIGGRSIDRGDGDDIDQNVHSDDEGMIEEIVTTVEEDKDLECKVKKKIETKKTVAEDPETHNKITKVVKTEVTEITRTITINDEHDLERAKRELGIDDVNKLLPSTQIIYNIPTTYSTSSWIDQPRVTQIQEKHYEPANEIVTSGDFPSDSPIKQHSPVKEILEQESQPLADATTVGRGPVVETITSSTIISQTSPEQQPLIEEQKSIENKKQKKKKSSLNLCSCTRSSAADYDEEQRKQKAATIVEQKSKQKKKASVTTTNAVLSSTIPTQTLISNEIKKLIANKKSLLINYIHSKIFRPAQLFANKEQNSKGQKISSRLLELLYNDRCSSWSNLSEQLNTEFANDLAGNVFIQPMVNTYEQLFTSKQSNLLNTFETIHNEKELKNTPENQEYIEIVQTFLKQRENQDNVTAIVKPVVENIDDTLQHLQENVQSDEKIINDQSINTKDIDMTDDIKKNLPVYNEEQLTKTLAEISPHKPITLAEAIAYQYIDLEDPKLGLTNDTAQRIKNLFRPLSFDDESALNLIRIKRAGQYLADFSLAENNAFEKFHLSEPFIYQLQQSFEPTLDFNEKQFRSLTDAILNNKEEYSNLQFDIGRTLIPAGDLKESSTNDFSQSDSGYSMTTATYESLAGKVKNEFETINEPLLDQSNDSEKTTDETKVMYQLNLDQTYPNEILTEISVKQSPENLERKRESLCQNVETKQESPSTPIYIKKRKSPGIFSCFRSKKAKTSGEQRGQPTVAPTTVAIEPQTTVSQTINPIEEKPITTDMAILPDGKRIYIDSYRERPGLDMSYKPDDFDNRFVLPVTKSVEESERPITPETSELQTTVTETVVEHHPIVHLEPRQGTMDPVDLQADKIEEKPIVHLEPRQGTMDPVDLQADKIEEKAIVHLEPRQGTMDPVDLQGEKVEEKPVIHLEARPATIEPVDVQPDVTPIVIPSTKKVESTVTKTSTPLNLHGAAVDLPEVELVEPGPLPTLTLTKDKKQKKIKEPVTTEKPVKVKKSTGGLCASCFGAKAAEKKKKETTSETAQAPIEQKKVVEEEKTVDVPLVPIATTVITTETVESSPLPVLTTTTAAAEETVIVPDVTVESVKEETIEQIVMEQPVLDDRLGATIEQLVSTEEPHYQLPSGEPVPLLPVENEYSVPEPINTYDIPRALDTPSVENIQINTEEKIVSNEIPEPVEVQKSSEIIESTIVTETITTMPNVDVKDSSNKGSYTVQAGKTKDKKVKEPKVKKSKVKEPKVKEPKVKEPKVKEPQVKGEKKSGLFSNLFRHSDRKTKAPALDLPDVETTLATQNEPHRKDSDPLHVPSVDLPKPDVQLPNYDQPEVNLTAGQVKQTSEFTIPSVDLPSIPNLQLPENEKLVLESNIDEMKVPSLNLPEVQYASEELETTKLPELHFKSEKDVITKVEEVIPELPKLTEVDNKEFPIDTESDIKTETTIPSLPVLTSNETEVPTKLELLSTEQKYTITDTHFVEPPELPVIVEKQTTENIESSVKVPELDFELPSTEPVAVLSKDIPQSPPSFDDDVPTTSSKIVSATEIVTAPVKTTEKELIESKSDVKKKSSTIPLCSCFGSKSNTQKDTVKTIKTKEKSNTLTAPKADLPPVDMPVPSSNISSTLKTKGSLRAPGNDLPPVDLSLPEVEQVHLLTGHSKGKKEKAPKKPKQPKAPKKQKAPIAPVVKEQVETIPTATSEAVVPVTTTITEVQVQQTTEVIPVVEKQIEEEIQLRPPTPPPTIVDEEQLVTRAPTPPSPTVETPAVENIQIESITNSSSITEKQPTEETKVISTESKKSPSFEIKAPALDIPELDIHPPSKTDAYIKHDESIITQSQSDSGLEAIISSHLQPSSTFSTNQTIEDLQQHTSISSGLGSEKTLDSLTTTTAESKTQQQKTTTHEPKRENSLLKHDFARKITMNEESRAKLIFRQNELKKCLENEISQSIEDFDPKKDQKSLNKILTHAIDLIKDKKVTTYPELKQKLIVEHKNDAFIVDPVVRSLYCTIEKQGLDNIDTPEFPLAIRDMVRLPAKQTIDTVTQLNKETSEEPTRIANEQPSAVRSCLTCGRSKSKPKVSTIQKTSTVQANGLLDERRRLQLNTHRNELGTILRDHIQSSQPAIRQVAEHPKEVEKIIRKSLTMVIQPKVLSYEQIRNDLKTEYKQTFYLVDPIIDIVRDTFDHCDITQMNEKTNLDILDSNISQTAQLYNQSTILLSTNEFELLKTNQLSWLTQYLIDNELKEKKSTKKQTKELNKIFTRAFELLSLNVISTWDEISSQLRREFPKAHDLCDRAVDLLKQAQQDGLLLQSQSPNAVQQDVTAINVINGNGKRRSSSLLTDRAKQNLKNNRKKIVSSIVAFLFDYNKPLYTENQIETYVNKTIHHLEHQKSGQFKTYNDLKDKLKKDFKNNHEKLIEQIVDVIEQVHATNQFDDLDKPEVQTLMKDRLDGKPLVIKEVYVSLPPRIGAYVTSKHDETSNYLSTSVNGDQTFNSSTSSHRIGRGLSWREANERARILFYRGKHPAIHYDEQAAAFDVRMLLETTAGGTQEIPVTDSDVHELLNSCGVQWDGVNIISLVDHSEDVVRAAEQAALKVIREKGLVDLRTPPSARNKDDNDDHLSSS